MVVFAHPHQDPNTAVLNVLQFLKAFVRDPNEKRIAVVQSGGDKGMDKLFCICVGQSLAISLRWKKEVLHRCLMWASKVRWESILTSKLMTDVERGISWPEKITLVMSDVRTRCGVPTRIASVFELFNCWKFCFIHAFISSRQLVRVDDGRAAEGVEFVLREMKFHASRWHGRGGANRG